MSISERRRAWVRSLLPTKPAQDCYELVGRWCTVTPGRAKNWCVDGFPPHQLRRLRALGEKRKAPFSEDLIAWPSDDASDEQNGAAA